MALWILDKLAKLAALNAQFCGELVQEWHTNTFTLLRAGNFLLPSDKLVVAPTIISVGLKPEA